MGAAGHLTNSEEAIAAYVATLTIDLALPGETPHVVKMDLDTFLFQLVERMQETARITRLCKTSTLFRTATMKPGDWMQLRAPFSPAVKAHVEAKHPGAIIANELLAAGQPLP